MLATAGLIVLAIASVAFCGSRGGGEPEQQLTTGVDDPYAGSVAAVTPPGVEGPRLVTDLPDVEPNYLEVQDVGIVAAAFPESTPQLEMAGTAVKELSTPIPPSKETPPSFQAAQLTEAEMREVLTLAGWPAELHDAALRVAFCESRWSPGAVGDHGNSTGLFQLWSGWYGHAGESAASWADPVVNARAALGAYRYSGGWKQWTCKPW